MRAFRTLAAGVDEAAPAHDLGRPVHHRMNLLVAEVQQPATFLERKRSCTQRNELPPKGVQAEQIMHGLPNRTPG